MRIRIKYGKTPAGRFLSHLDLVRAWERAMRRARIPLAFSQGYNPHPKMSFGSALAVDVTSSGEYMDVELKKELSIEEIKGSLEKYLPETLQVYEIKKINQEVPSLMATINRARYQVKALLVSPLSQEDLSKIIDNLLKKNELFIQRHTKKGVQEKNIRPGIFELQGKIIGDGEVFLEFIVETGSQGNVRPEEVVQVLERNGVPLNPDSLEIHREGLYVWNEKGLISPLRVMT